jgi:LysR family nitrogen assimilation transcriptional regulator
MPAEGRLPSGASVSCLARGAKRGGATDIELRHLCHFVRVVDLGSLARAAAELHVAASALSQHVAALEADVGTRLLLRTPRGVQPTDAGRELYRHAQALLKQASDAHDAVVRCAAQPGGSVAIGMPLSLVAPLALPVFEAVRARHPGIELQVHEALSGTILEWIKNGRLALGIAYDDGDLDGLAATRLFEERLFLVVCPRSPLARRKAVSVRELARMDLVLPSPGHGVRVRVERALAQAGAAPGHVAEVNSLTLMKQAAAAGLGATVLSWPGVADELAHGTLAAVEIVRPPITRVAALCVPAALPRTRAADCVLAVATQAIRETVRRAGWRGVTAAAGE